MDYKYSGFALLNVAEQARNHLHSNSRACCTKCSEIRSKNNCFDPFHKNTSSEFWTQNCQTCGHCGVHSKNKK